MSGAQKGILAHSQTAEARNLRVNDVPVREMVLVELSGASLGIPTVMVSGGAVPGKEALTLFGHVECAEVKYGFNATSWNLLSDKSVCDLIHERARRSTERLSDYKPYNVKEPVELKIELAHYLGLTYDRRLCSKGAVE
jgi:D-aminopeptidase